MTDQALILVAEDDPDDQYFFQEAIETLGPVPLEAHYLFDGEQLLRLLRDKIGQGYSRSLVVLDLNMQVKNGRTTLREIRQDPTFANVPVVILSTSSNEEDVEYCRTHGAAAFFCKPNSIMGLVDIIRTLWQGYLS